MNSSEWAITEQKSRDDINIKRYSRVLRSRFMALLGTGRSEGSNYSSRFYRLKNGVGGLFFVKPKVLGSLNGDFSRSKLRESLKMTRIILEHNLKCTKILEESREDGFLHPIFCPVKIGTRNFRPYIWRQREGGHINEENETEMKFLRCIRYFLSHQLKEIGFKGIYTDLIGGPFDITSGNITIVQGEHLSDFTDTINLLGDKILQEEYQIAGIKEELFDQLYEKGLRIMLFDYGTWIKPDGKNKYGKVAKP